MDKSENAFLITNCSKWSIHPSHFVFPPTFRLLCTNIGPAAIIVGSVSKTIETAVSKSVTVQKSKSLILR